MYALVLEWGTRTAVVVRRGMHVARWNNDNADQHHVTSNCTAARTTRRGEQVNNGMLSTTTSCIPRVHIEPEPRSESLPEGPSPSRS